MNVETSNPEQMNYDSNNNTLCFFTASYPYGIKSETFIEAEMKYHSEAFKKVYIIPQYKESNFIREVQENVEILDFLTKEPITKKNKVAAGFWSPLLSIKIILSEISAKGLRVFVKNFKIFIDILLTQLCVAKKIENHLLHRLPPNSIFYDFWFENSTLALSILKHKKLINGFVTKAHGFDVYDERWGSVGVPYRNWKIKKIDALYLVSDFGIRYIKERISAKYHGKIHLSRYGVIRKPVKYEKSAPKPYKTIVSCARLVSFKMIDQIPVLLKGIKEPVHWVHFGDGEEREKVEQACKQLPDNIKCTLMGQVDNKDVVEYYVNNQVDLLISLSTTEGLPVSMIEALSFNIPIVAVPAGGVPELVIDGETGFLLNNPEDTIKSTQILAKALNYPFETNKIEAFFNNNINADVNYPNFIKEICQ